MKLFILILSLVLAAPTSAAVYKTVRPDGSVVYSDQPPKNAAQPLHLPPLQMIPAESLAPATPPPEAAAEVYQDLAIVLPENNGTIRDAIGQVPVQVALQPALLTKEGDIIVVYLDGQLAAQGSGTAFILNNVERGSHSLEAAVLSEKGQSLIRSSSITFFVHRPTLNQAR